MTPEAQRIAIATACGWRMVEAFEWEGDVRKPKQFHQSGALLPDYINDLNAIAQAERALIDGKPTDTRSLWLDHLALAPKWPTVENALNLRFEVNYLVARATATQRAEALLKTLGLWKD